MKKKYKIRLSQSTVKDLEKLDSSVRGFMYNKFYELADNPYKHDKLSGSFKGLRFQHCMHSGAEYRFIYLVDEEDRLVVIALAGSRENIYRELAGRL